MFSFFYRIRQKSLLKNQFTKYLLYAIGEIILIVIGIFLAIQLNNWNENRKQEILEIQYLQRLVEDLAQDTIYINKRIEYSKFAGGHFNSFIQEMYTIQKDIEDAKGLFGHLSMNTDHLVIQNSTYQELNSTGKLSIIKNQTVKKSIANHYMLCEKTSSNIEEFNNYTTKSLFKAVTNVNTLNKFFDMKIQTSSTSKTPYNDPTLILKDEWKFINDPHSKKFQALETMAFTYWLRHEEFSKTFQSLKENSIELINQINEELEVRKN